MERYGTKIDEKGWDETRLNEKRLNETSLCGAEQGWAEEDGTGWDETGQVGPKRDGRNCTRQDEMG